MTSPATALSSTSSTSTSTPATVDTNNISSKQTPTTTTAATTSIASGNNKKRRVPVQPTDYELSRFWKWSTVDDLLLRQTIESNPDMDFEDIAKSIKFNHAFTAEELRERWNVLLYDPEVAEAVANNMVVVMTQSQSRVPWSDDEDIAILEELQKGNTSFHYIFDRHRETFHPCRTAKTIENHYRNILKKNPKKCEDLMAIAANKKAHRGDVNAFSDDGAESLVDAERDVMIKQAKRKYVRKSQAEKKKAQKVATRALELEKEHGLNSAMPSAKRQKQLPPPPQKEATTSDKKQLQRVENVYCFGELQGNVCELSITKEISVIGRGTKQNAVDLDLNMETGPNVNIHKVSRRQAELQLYLAKTYKTTSSVATGYESETSQLPPTYSYTKGPVLEPRFSLTNLGKKKIEVNDQIVSPNQQVEVSHGCMIVFPGDFKFLFLANMDEVQRWVNDKAIAAQKLAKKKQEEEEQAKKKQEEEEEEEKEQAKEQDTQHTTGTSSVTQTQLQTPSSTPAPPTSEPHPENQQSAQPPAEKTS